MSLLAHAERLKLARLLGVPAGELDYLEKLAPGDLRVLRERVSATLFGRHERQFRRAVGPARLLPARLSAFVAERVFGPMLTARLSSVMPPQRAVEVAKHLSPKFMADVSAELDPARAQAVLGHIAPQTITVVARELLKRREFIVMSQFVDHLPMASLRPVLESVLDDEAVVRIGFYVEDRARLAELLGLLGPERLDGILLKLAHGDAGLQEAGIAVVSQLPARLQGRVGARLAVLGEGVAIPLARAAKREGAEDVVRGIIRHAPERTRAEATASGLLAKVERALGS